MRADYCETFGGKKSNRAIVSLFSKNFKLSTDPNIVSNMSLNSSFSFSDDSDFEFDFEKAKRHNNTKSKNKPEAQDTGMYSNT